MREHDFFVFPPPWQPPESLASIFPEGPPAHKAILWGRGGRNLHCRLYSSSLLLYLPCEPLTKRANTFLDFKPVHDKTNDFNMMHSKERRAFSKICYFGIGCSVFGAIILGARMETCKYTGVSLLWKVRGRLCRWFVSILIKSRHCIYGSDKIKELFVLASPTIYAPQMVSCPHCLTDRYAVFGWNSHSAKKLTRWPWGNNSLSY